MGLYENIKNTAKEKGYSINQLEKELGFPRSYINKFKTIQPSAEKIKKIADFLGVSMDSLTRDDDAPVYYINEETAQIAQEIFENKDLRILFDAGRGASAESLRLASEILIAMNKGSDSDDT